MKLNIVDKGHSNVMNGADIPHGTVFTSKLYNDKVGLFVKYSNGCMPDHITIVCSPGLTAGDRYVHRLDGMRFPDYKVVEELTAVVK